MTNSDVEEMAKALLEERLAPVRGLKAATDDLERAQIALGDAERARAEQWRSAVSAGWSEAELKRLGLKAPQRRTPGRPGGRQKKNQTQPEASPEQEPEATP